MSDSETAGVVFRSYFVGFSNQSQKLVCRIRNLIVGFRNYSSGFRNYFVGFRSRIQTPPYLETVLSYPECQIQKLFCRVQKLFSRIQELRIHFQKLIHGSERRVLGLVQGWSRAALGGFFRVACRWQSDRYVRRWTRCNVSWAVDSLQLHVHLGNRQMSNPPLKGSKPPPPLNIYIERDIRFKWSS